VDGSRTLWIAIAFAAGVVVVMMMRPRLGGMRPPRRVLLACVGLFLAAAVLAVVTGIGSTLAERLLNLDSVGWRTAMWSSLLKSWTEHPIAGSGPGSFTWVLQPTGYFDTNTHAPRHPDSAPIQLLAEGGLLGMSSMAVLLAASVPRILRSRSAAPTFALVTFAVAALASNPTDFAFVVVVAIAWLAYAVPRHAVAKSPPDKPTRRVRLTTVVTGTVAVVIGVAWAAVTFGTLSYEQARGALAKGDLAATSDALGRAQALDPGMALYPRQAGMVELLRDEPPDAVNELLRATELNPNDDLAWRALYLAARATGDAATADAALANALRLQRSDPTNLLLYAQSFMRGPNRDRARDVLTEVVQAWPPIVTSAAWRDFLAGSGFSGSELEAAAAQRWIDGEPIPDLQSDQGLWLTALGGRADARPLAIEESGYGERLGQAMTSLLECGQATNLLREAPAEDLRQLAYWQLRVRDAGIAGGSAEQALRMIELMSRRQLEDPEAVLNPLRENALGGTSADVWGYRRSPMDWPMYGAPLPSPTGGEAAWILGLDCHNPLSSE
jgi:tetratricopeptide (TPR) repeat protein